MIWSEAPPALRRWTLASQGDLSSRGRRRNVLTSQSAGCWMLILPAARCKLIPSVFVLLPTWTSTFIISGETFTHLNILSQRKGARKTVVYFFIFLASIMCPTCYVCLLFKLKQILKILTIPWGRRFCLLPFTAEETEARSVLPWLLSL